MNIKVERWNDHEIRFVEVEPSEWWAVLADVTKPLELQNSSVARRLRAVAKQVKKDVISKHPLLTTGGKQEMLIVSEYGIYEAVTQSRKEEAIQFRFWIYDIIKELRQQSGLEGFQVFRMLDKEHQKETMSKLSQSLKQPKRVNFIKANTIANKAISTKYGYDKMIKKKDMTPDMLIERQPILDDTVDLMSVADRFDLDISVSQKVYEKYIN